MRFVTSSRQVRAPLALKATIGGEAIPRLPPTQPLTDPHTRPFCATAAALTPCLQNRRNAILRDNAAVDPSTKAWVPAMGTAIAEARDGFGRLYKRTLGQRKPREVADSG
jgi:hypothetical protein